jgi:uncharacterized membrane protein YhdT
MPTYIVGVNSGLCIAVAITGVAKGSIGLVIWGLFAAVTLPALALLMTKVIVKERRN